MSVAHRGGFVRTAPARSTSSTAGAIDLGATIDAHPTATTTNGAPVRNVGGAESTEDD
jgi:hypothetical protein